MPHIHMCAYIYTQTYVITTIIIASIKYGKYKKIIFYIIFIVFSPLLFIPCIF